MHQDRIGASNFFWSFPSEAAVKVIVYHINATELSLRLHLVYVKIDKPSLVLVMRMQLKNDVQQKTQQLASQEKEMTSLEQKIQESRRGKEDSVGCMPQLHSLLISSYPSPYRLDQSYILNYCPRHLSAHTPNGAFKQHFACRRLA